MAIKIDNSAESAVGGSWGAVNKTALRNRLMRAVEDGEAGATAAVRECYAVVGSRWREAPSQELGYPHHVLRGDTLVVHVGGVIAAVQRARQQNEARAIAHLRRHVQELVQAGKIEESVLVED